MNLHNDWKKLAAAAAIDDSEVEKAFLDQAYAMVSNKARPMMQAPYRLGFEIVFKNQDNTRMVGIFAFRVPSIGLLYAPVFFIGGEIKGTDMLYKHDTKRFVPMNEEWVRFLLENNVSAMGTGVERRFTTSIQQHLNLNKIKAPTIGTVGKQASASDDFVEFAAKNDAMIQRYAKKRGITPVMAATIQYNISRGIPEDDPITDAYIQAMKQASDAAPDYKGAWEGIMKLAAERANVTPVLRDFIVQDGGASSIELLAQAMERDFKFASHVHALIPDAVFAPVDFSVKQASAKPVLVLHRGQYDPGTVKCASEAYHERGFWLEDMRKEAALTEVFDASNNEWSSPSTPGVYEVVMKGGTLQKLFCARENEAEFPQANSNVSPLTYVESCGCNDGDRQRYTLIDIESKEVLPGARRVIGKPVELIDCGQEREDKKEPAYMLTSMESGNAYVLFDTANKTVTCPFWVKSKRTVDGVTQYTICTYRGYGVRELRYNPDYTAVKVREGVCGNNARFIKVKGKCEERDTGAPYLELPCTLAPGSQADVTTFLLGGGVKFASVQCRNDEFSLRHGSKHQTRGMGKVAMVCHLARDLGMHADVATDLVERAEKNKTADFCFLPKSASAVQLQAEPQFDPQLDPQFGVMIDPQPSYTVATDFMPEQLPPQRIGDAWDPANLRGVLETANPNQLAELSQQLGVPNIFEHGVVGELVKTYDAAAMIQKYIPKLEEALDCLGRILFLLYWKPEDFKQAYGADDLTNKENEILSNFKSLGDLLLDLLKQTRPNRSGSVSMGT